MWKYGYGLKHLGTFSFDSEETGVHKTFCSECDRVSWVLSNSPKIILIDSTLWECMSMNVCKED